MNTQTLAQAMSVKAWGTRGSIAVSNEDTTKAGGNTTCYEVFSQCLPPGMHLMLDAGTGFVPAGWSYLSEIGKGLHYVNLFTHWHWDHIMGLTLAPPTFIDSVPMTLYGPVDQSCGPKEMISHLFQRPFFPVDAKRIAHKMTFKPMPDFDVSVMVIHPEAGIALFNRDEYIKKLNGKKQLPIKGKSYPLEEFLIITMHPANHGNSTCISYRFEEMPTGKVFVLLTDHEDEMGIQASLRQHLKNADLLIVDAQYEHKRYMTQTTRFGHGTPHGVVKLGVVAGVKRIGITHHDPRSIDAFLEGTIIPEALIVLKGMRTDTTFMEMHKVEKVILTDQDVFLCYDYVTYQL